eukprot:1568060-Rhodomonas_salina.2
MFGTIIQIHSFPDAFAVESYVLPSARLPDAQAVSDSGMSHEEFSSGPWVANVVQVTACEIKDKQPHFRYKWY